MTNNNSNNSQLNGRFNLYIGPMFSGKTTTLLESYTRYTIGGRKCLLVQHKSDTRDEEHKIITHDGRSTKAEVICENLYEIDDIVGNYQVICIDEIQFFQDAPIFCDLWANRGLIVEASGLNGNSKRKQFPVISRILPQTEFGERKLAICRESGDNAPFTYRTSSDVGDVVIGGKDKYKPVDRKTYFADDEILKNDEIEKFGEFLDFYEKRNTNITPEIKQFVINEFNKNYVKLRCYLDFVRDTVKKYEKIYNANC